MRKQPVILVLLALLPGLGCTMRMPPKFSTGTVKAGQLEVYYERRGQGTPLLLLHAGLQDHTMWEEQVMALSAHYDVITPDLPFHGKTMGMDTSILVADVLRILLDSLHVPTTAVGGLSMGASAAQDLVIAYPARVTKVVLISSGINGYDKTHPIDPASMAWYGAFSKALNEKDTVRAAVEFTRAWAEGIYRSGDSLKAPVSQYVYRTTLANLRQHQMKGWPLLQNHPPAVERLSSIQVPVLIVDGDKDLPYIGVSSDYLEKQIAGARRVTLPGVAHMLNLEKPDAVNKLLEGFLGSINKSN